MLNCDRLPPPRPLKVFTGVLEPHPAAIAQSEQQRVIYTDSVYALSAYPVTKQARDGWLMPDRLVMDG